MKLEILQQPKLQEYSDYREYLIDKYAFLKKQKTKLSLAVMGKKLGQSRMSLKHVLDKSRHISNEKIPRYIEAFEIPTNQTCFFRELVFFSKAKSTETKNFHFENIINLKNSRLNEKWLSNSEILIFKEWFYPVVSELSYLQDFSENPEWIQKKLAFPVRKELILQALKDLKRIKKLKDEVSQSKLSENYLSHIYKNYHRKQLELGGKALDQQSINEREFFTLTIPVDKKRFQILKKKIQQFRHELHDLLGDGDPADTIMQVNMQSFIVAKSSDQGEKI